MRQSSKIDPNIQFDFNFILAPADPENKMESVDKLTVTNELKVLVSNLKNIEQLDNHTSNESIMSCLLNINRKLTKASQYYFAMTAAFTDRNEQRKMIALSVGNAGVIRKNQQAEPLFTQLSNSTQTNDQFETLQQSSDFCNVSYSIIDYSDNEDICLYAHLPESIFIDVDKKQQGPQFKHLEINTADFNPQSSTWSNLTEKKGHATQLAHPTNKGVIQLTEMSNDHLWDQAPSRSCAPVLAGISSILGVSGLVFSALCAFSVITKTAATIGFIGVLITNWPIVAMVAAGLTVLGLGYFCSKANLFGRCCSDEENINYPQSASYI